MGSCIPQLLGRLALPDLRVERRVSEHIGEGAVHIQCVVGERRPDVVRGEKGEGGAVADALQEGDAVKAIFPICFYGAKL